MSLPDLGPESVLSDASGELAKDVRDRLDLALRYLANWYRATADSDDKSIWWAKIDNARDKVEAAFKAIDPADLFLGNTELALYADAQAVFPALWRDLNLSLDTIPRPDLLSQAADFFDTLTEYPAYLLPKIGDMIARAVGGALGRILEQLWPWLALAGAGLGVYYFWPVIAAALGSARRGMSS